MDAAISFEISNIKNVSILNFKVGDKITSRNTADCSFDYITYSGFDYFADLWLMKRPSNLAYSATDGNNANVFRWQSGLAANAVVYDYRASQSSPISKPFTTIMPLIIESGFNYYLAKMFYQVQTVGSSIIISGSFYGDDSNNYNLAYGG